MACNYNSAATEDDGTCTYPGCQDPAASNYDEAAGCAGECLYLTYDCSSIGDEAWTGEDIGLFPDWQQAMHGVGWAGEWVLNIPATIVEPGSGVVYGIHHMDWTGLEGLPDWVETVSYELGQLDASAQYCIAASGTPAAPGLHEITATGEVFISIFGQPFSIGEQSFSAGWRCVGKSQSDSGVHVRDGLKTSSPLRRWTMAAANSRDARTLKRAISIHSRPSTTVRAGKRVTLTRFPFAKRTSITTAR